MKVRPLAVLCVSGDEGILARMVEEVGNAVGVEWTVDASRSRVEALQSITRLQGAGAEIPLVVAGAALADGSGAGLLEAVAGSGLAARTLLVGGSPPLHGAWQPDQALPADWEPGSLRSVLVRLVTEFLVEERPETLGTVPEVLDVEVLTHAVAEAGERERSVNRQLAGLQRSFLADRGLDDDVVEEALIADLDRALDNPARTSFAPGEVILREGDPVDGIHLVLDGEVRLTRRVDGEDIVFHYRTAGRIIGLLAIAGGSPAFFDCTAITPVTAVHLSLEDLDRALHRSPTLAVHLSSVLLRSLARRNLRAVELRIERDRLARDLAEDRDRLATALEQLTGAQARLIESDRLATLGELVAGIAHELNNPVTALLRAADHLEADVLAVLGEPGAMPGRAGVIEDALRRQPLSTREARARQRELAQVLGDDETARRLVTAGVTDPDEARRLLDADDEHDPLAAVERLTGIGEALRIVRVSAGRVGALVRSLRSYARDTGDHRGEVDVTEGIDESLRLLAHRLRGTTVVRDFSGPVLVWGSPGDLNQVWTNLIANAAEAMEGSGTLTVRTSSGGDQVTVAIEDTGPGIPAGEIDRIFEMHFTTKHGRVEFGLGLGLRIAQDVVQRHGGSIRVESRPGRTVFTVTLPREAAS